MAFVVPTLFNTRLPKARSVEIQRQIPVAEKPLGTIRFGRLCYPLSKGKSTSSSLRQTLLLLPLSDTTTTIAC